VKTGDKVKFSFAGREIEGTIDRIFDKTVYIRTDMPRQKGKVLKRKLKDVKG
jgi:hypothetical protein